MNKKALGLAVCLAISYSPTSYGLGLGEIESSSHLNQPFSAKIKLLSTSIADTKRLKVRVASPEVFSRVGIERPSYLNSISFTPKVENGKPVIIVSSSQPINQPFLNFLLEVSWPNGQLLKEYTVLLDPPVLVQPDTAIASNTAGVRAEPKRQPPPAINSVQATPQPPQKTIPAPAPKKQTIAQGKSPPVAKTPRPKKARSSRRTSKYRVVSGDTLYKVAKKLKYRGVRTEQMMMALYRSNPTAFRKRNVNYLKKGALLTRPSRSEAKEISYRKAKSSIYKQSSQWKNYRSKLSKTTVPQNEVKRAVANTNNTPTKTETPKAPQQARIEVLGNPSSDVDAKNLSATGAAKIDELERRLTQANESLAARANANTELKSRVSELESLLRKKNRLITLKNEQLAELQAKLGMPVSDPKAKGTDEGADISQQVKNVTDQDGSIVRSQDTTADDATGKKLAVIDKDNSSIFEKQPEPAKDSVLATSPDNGKPEAPKSNLPQGGFADSDGGILGLLSSPLVMALGGGSLLALLAGWLFMRRKKGAGDYEEYSTIDFDDPEFAPGKDNKAKAIDLNKGGNNEVYSGFDDLDFGNTEPEVKEKKSKANNIDVNDDILQEADVYIVYGLHDQAEVELKKAIEKKPNNLHYHAKLLENYQASSNVEAFDKQSEIFSKLPNDTEGNKDKLWKKINSWAQDIKSSHSLFEGASPANKSGIIAGAVAAVAVGGIAVTAGKAFAEDKLDDTKDLFNDPSPELDKKVAIPSKPAVDDLGLNDLGFDKDLDFSLPDTPQNNAQSDDLTLDKLLKDTGKGSSVPDLSSSNTLADDFDLSSLNDMLNDVDQHKPDGVAPPSAFDSKTTGLGSEFEDLLDLDLSDLSDELLAKPNPIDEKPVDLGLSRLNLELDNDNDLNKILPSGSPYAASKDDAYEDNLLGDLDDDMSFMDFNDGEHDLKETQVSTKLDLARAYLDMGDIEGARNTLEEVMMEGNDDQKKEAKELLHQTG